MDTKRQRKPRQTIELEQLKSDPNSFLSLHFDDPVVRKLETYRLYRAGYAAEDIAQAFGWTRQYLYMVWRKFEAEGIEGLVDKRWGTAPRKRTSEREAQIVRAKALAPQRSDSDLAEEYGMHRDTVYELLKEHGIQDLHRVLTGDSPEPESSSTDGEKGGPPPSPAQRPCC